jgi:ABC-type antimicrobial peptide transport system permease subunit
VILPGRLLIHLNTFLMLFNYLRIALRNLRKNKSYVIINTLGLGIALACCITAYLLLAYNLEFDSFHKDENVSRIFKIHTISREKDGSLARDVQAPITLLPTAAEEISGIQRYTRFLYGGGALHSADNAFNEQFAFADSTFFDLFDYPLTTGSHSSFHDKNTIFITEKIAQKYFGNEDPVGKLMVYTIGDSTEIDVVVGGVVKKFPANNTFNFDILMRMEHFMEMNKIRPDDWSDWRNPTTFVELSSPDIASQVAAQFSKYIPNRNKLRTDMVVESYQLVPFKSKFTGDQIRYNWVQHRIEAAPLLIFGLMAAVILLIACFNLTNTSIAMAGKRLKEVGVRKSVGASRRNIVFQLLFETLLLITISVLVGLLMAQVIVPAFISMWNLPYELKDLNGVNLFIALVILVFLAALVAGMYPALYSSKFKPTALLKGTVKMKGTNGLTRSLVAAQFALSVVVMIAGVVFIQNTRYQERIKFGYDHERIITVSVGGEREFEAMEKAILSNPKILSVGVSDGNIGRNSYQTPVRVDTGQYNVQALGVGNNYFETMGLRFAMGRSFDLEKASDQHQGIIVNKAFIERVGMSDPIDKVVVLHNVRRRILGVIENHIDNLYRSKEPEPFVFYPAAKNQYISLLVKTEPADLIETQKFLEATWKEILPGKPFESQFQQDILTKNSKQMNGNMEKIFFFITLLGGLLSASGIFALASLNVIKRTKEIGIRKALGATVNSVVGLLNREFIIVLSAAAIAGSTAGYYATDKLLGTLYAYRIGVGIIPVMVSALFIFGVGILTTSATIIKAARSNPVNSLRTE